MLVHKISSNNQTSFKQIKPKDTFTQEVIEKDFNSSKSLRTIYDKLVESQKKNPVDISIDSFCIDKNEIPLDSERWDNWYWYQRAIVGKKVFVQKTTSHNTDYEPSITFLKRACFYANFLNNKQKLLKFLKLGK